MVIHSTTTALVRSYFGSTASPAAPGCGPSDLSTNGDLLSDVLPHLASAKGLKELYQNSMLRGWSTGVISIVSGFVYTGVFGSRYIVNMQMQYFPTDQM